MKTRTGRLHAALLLALTACGAGPGAATDGEPGAGARLSPTSSAASGAPAPAETVLRSLEIEPGHVVEFLRLSGGETSIRERMQSGTQAAVVPPLVPQSSLLSLADVYVKLRPRDAVPDALREADEAYRALLPRAPSTGASRASRAPVPPAAPRAAITTATASPGAPKAAAIALPVLGPPVVDCEYTDCQFNTFAANVCNHYGTQLCLKGDGFAQSPVETLPVQYWGSWAFVPSTAVEGASYGGYQWDFQTDSWVNLWFHELTPGETEWDGLNPNPAYLDDDIYSSFYAGVGNFNDSVEFDLAENWNIAAPHAPFGDYSYAFVGQPPSPHRIAVCQASPGDVTDHKFYDLTTNHALYVSASGLNDTWVEVTTPGAADSMACDGSNLVVMNYDKSLWQLVLNPDGSFKWWVSLGAANDAAVLGGGPGLLTAVNTDQSLWVSDERGQTTLDWKEEHRSWPASRLTGAFWAPGNASRFWSLNTDGTLWFNDGLVVDSPGTWRPVTPIPGLTPVEIAAIDADSFLVLDASGTLWHVQFVSASQSITVTLGAPDGGWNTWLGWASGSVTLYADGSMVANHAYVQAGSQFIGPVGGPSFYLACSWNEFNISWSGSMGGSFASAPTANLTAYTPLGNIGDDWQNLSWYNVQDALDNVAVCELNMGGGAGGWSGDAMVCQKADTCGNDGSNLGSVDPGNPVDPGDWGD